jgi:hypothetical protein
MTTSGVLTEYPLPTATANAIHIVAGPDGAMWFTEQVPYGVGKIGRITVPASTSPLVSAVLPSSRSVEVGNRATAFATIINSGSATATGCQIAPVTSVPASFVYQTTNPATNALTGSPNTPVSIAAGRGQSFVIAFTPNAPFVPTTVALGFDCAGIDAAPSDTGLNTLLYSASATPVPDVVTLAATAQNDGILHITGTSGSNAFAVASVNVGSSRVDHRHGEHRRGDIAAEHQPLPDQSAVGAVHFGDRTERYIHDQRQRDPDRRHFRDRERRCAVRASDEPHLCRVQRRERGRARLDQRRRRDAVTAGSRD